MVNAVEIGSIDEAGIIGGVVESSREAKVGREVVDVQVFGCLAPHRVEITHEDTGGGG